ncbi:hypothetical protein PGB90_006729 [Kerria lacca]
MLFNHANDGIISVTWSSSLRITSTPKMASGQIDEFSCGVGFTSPSSTSLSLSIGGLGFGSAEAACLAPCWRPSFAFRSTSTSSAQVFAYLSSFL